MQQGKTTISTITTQEYSERNFHTDVILCGEKVEGEVSISENADTEGNKSAEVELDISSKNGPISGSVSGSVSQDKDGNNEGKVEAGFKAKF